MGKISDFDIIIDDLADSLYTKNALMITCPKTFCGCGMCITKSKDNISELFNKYTIDELSYIKFLKNPVIGIWIKLRNEHLWSWMGKSINSHGSFGLLKHLPKEFKYLLSDVKPESEVLDAFKQETMKF